MTDDEILAHLADAVRRRPGVAAPLSTAMERVAEGDVRDEAIDAVAAEQGLDPSIARDALRPLGDEFKRDVLANVLAARAKQAVPRPALRIVEGPSAAKKRRPASVLAGVTTALALAASTLLWVSSRTQVDGLPLYVFSATGGDKDLRGASAPVDVRLRRDSTLSMLMRPSDRVRGGVEARLAVVKDGNARVWSGPLDVSVDGAVRVRASAVALFPEGVGGFDVVLVVGRAGTLPTGAEAIAHARDDEPPNARVGRLHVELVGDR
ncbi:MAG: hypothetical protein ACHREM_10250 [Polyangiales bacterium]